jgi:hypothetical protein
MIDPINITVEGGTQEQAGLIGDIINNSLSEAGFTDVNSRYEGSDPEADVTKALRNLNPAIFDTEINIDAIGVVPSVGTGEGDDDVPEGPDEQD